MLYPGQNEFESLFLEVEDESGVTFRADDPFSLDGKESKTDEAALDEAGGKTSEPAAPPAEGEPAAEPETEPAKDGEPAAAEPAPADGEPAGAEPAPDSPAEPAADPEADVEKKIEGEDQRQANIEEFANLADSISQLNTYAERILNIAADLKERNEVGIVVEKIDILQRDYKTYSRMDFKTGNIDKVSDIIEELKSRIQENSAALMEYCRKKGLIQKKDEKK